MDDNKTALVNLGELFKLCSIVHQNYSVIEYPQLQWAADIESFVHVIASNWDEDRLEKHKDLLNQIYTDARQKKQFAVDFSNIVLDPNALGNDKAYQVLLKDKFTNYFPGLELNYTSYTSGHIAGIAETKPTEKIQRTLGFGL